MCAMMLCCLSCFACAIDVPSNVPMITGEVAVTSSNEATFNFVGTNGWLRIDTGAASATVSIATRNDPAAEWTWRYIDQSNGVFMTGVDQYTQILVWTSQSTNVKYAAGYLRAGYDGTLCNRLFVSTQINEDNYKFERTTVDCFVDGQLRNDLILTGQTDSGVSAWVYADGRRQRFTNAQLTGSAVSLHHSNLPAFTSALNVNSQTPSSAVNVGEVIQESAYPVLVYGTFKYSTLKDGECTSYNDCGEPNKTPVGLIAGIVIAIIVVIVVVVLITFLYKKCKKSRVENKSSSSSSGSSSSSSSKKSQAY